ncbi:hypothetical protein D6C91_10178 [Aureobasidium pullulans]|uniref:Uncharacterized protein n=1 Tax=Aureobasidium pullulans TaxID=5580 RepID=A0A4S9SAD3_AURPU|nr:hypothetical protein D6C91_10178 [Aureobasidium pullulans]
MASHGGQLTFAQKRMMAMQANAGNSSLASSQYSASLHPTPTSVPFPGDVEMHDVSAATSTDGSPLNDPSHPRVNSIFSASAKPFTPPSTMIVSSSMAPSSALPITSTMAPPITPAKRAPPHRALKAQTPQAPPAPVDTPIVATKPETLITHVLSDHSAAPSPKRRAGPHSKLGPHAQKARSSVPATSVDSSSPVQVSVTSKATTPAKDVWVDVQQVKPEPETWVEVKDAQIVDVEQPESEQAEMDIEQSSIQATLGSSAQDWGTPAVVQSTPVAETQEWGTPAAVKVEQSSPQPKPLQQTAAPEVVPEPPTPKAAHPAHQQQAKVKTESTEVASSNEVSFDHGISNFMLTDWVRQMSTESTTTRRYGRHEYLSMLLDMNDTAKGRELIRAFADHIHAGGNTSMNDVAALDAEQEIFMEVSSGSRLGATVPQNTALGNVIKQVAKMAHVDESEVCVILKVGDKGSA